MMKTILSNIGHILTSIGFKAAGKSLYLFAHREEMKRHAENTAKRNA